MHRPAKKSGCAELAPPEQPQGISSCPYGSISARERCNIPKRTRKGNTVKAPDESGAWHGLRKEERNWRSLPADTCAFSQGFTSGNFHYFKQHISLAQGEE